MPRLHYLHLLSRSRPNTHISVITEDRVGGPGKGRLADDDRIGNEAVHKYRPVHRIAIKGRRVWAGRSYHICQTHRLRFGRALGDLRILYMGIDHRVEGGDTDPST